MNKYIKYFNYIIEHKKNVFKECWKQKMYKEAILHDLSKFRPSEFIPYAEYFYGVKDCKKCKNYMKCDFNQIGLGLGSWGKECPLYKDINFNKAWELHYKRNKHHPEYWEGKVMDHRSIREMVCDLKAMSKKFGGTAQEYYLDNYFKWNLNYDSRMWLELELGLNDSVICNYGHTLEDFANIYDEETFNNCFEYIIKEYDKDIYTMLKNKTNYGYSNN